jgi:hypothetical protein
MKALCLTLSIIVVLLTNSCAKAPPTDGKAHPQNNAVKSNSRTPESVGAFQLSHPESFPQEYREAASSVAQELRQDRENPAAFYGHVDSASGALVFHLWHEDAFKEQGLEGNPGGKCRDFYYDVESHRVTQKLFWQ